MKRIRVEWGTDVMACGEWLSNTHILLRRDWYNRRGRCSPVLDATIRTGISGKTKTAGKDWNTGCSLPLLSAVAKQMQKTDLIAKDSGVNFCQFQSYHKDHNTRLFIVPPGRLVGVGAPYAPLASSLIVYATEDDGGPLTLADGEDLIGLLATKTGDDYDWRLSLTKALGKWDESKGIDDGR